MSYRAMMVAAGAMLAMPAVAQTNTPSRPTVEGYLCTFAGKCDGVTAPTETRAAPETKGFRLARPVADTAPANTRSQATARAAAAVQPPRAMRSARYGATAPRRGKAPVYTAPSYTPPPVAYADTAGSGGRPRADLMIGFELNSARLTPEGAQAARVFAKAMTARELKTKRFSIEGHTDLRGARSLNMTLSQARAEAVTIYLVSLGVARERLQPRGFGPDVPLPGHSSDDPENRRVEAELIS